MTVFLRDMSDYDSNEDVTGFVGVTHKATEGTTVTHKNLASRLNRYRAQGVPVLGAYHVVRTPGAAGNGSLNAQLSFWFAYLDAQIPWWRSYPHFILQIDLEKWPYDQVSATVGKQFAQILVDSGVPGWKVTYASRGQYGNSLTGIATPLWNAAYTSSTYPGDGSSAWAQYSGQTPVLWQYTSTPFDKNAFRGSLDDLLALIGGGDTVALDSGEYNLLWAGSWLAQRLAEDADTITVPANKSTNYPGYTTPNLAKQQRQKLAAQVAALSAGTGPTQDQVNAAVAAVMNDPAWLAKLGAALASHIKVS